MLVKNLRQPEGFKSSRPPSVLIICSYTCSCFPMPKATHPPVRTPSSPILAPQNHAAYFCICCCSAWNHLIWGPNYSFPPALNPSCKLSGNLRNLGIRLYQITFLILLIFFFSFSGNALLYVGSYSPIRDQAHAPAAEAWSPDYWITREVAPSVQCSLFVVSNSLRPHGPQHAKPPCPSPTPRAC